MSFWLKFGYGEEKNLKQTYQPVINTQTTRQSCKIIVERGKETEESKPQLVQLTLTKKISKSIDDKKTKYLEEKKTNLQARKNSYKSSKGQKNFVKSFQFKKEEVKSLAEGEKSLSLKKTLK